MATAQFLNWIEGQAHGLRKMCGVPAFGRMEPLELARKMEVVVINPSEIQGLPAGVLARLDADSSAWSGGTLCLPGGKFIVVMNASHAEARQRATLMEELVHIRLKHKPSQLITNNGVTMRTWSQTHETQAYWVGAAALLPRQVIKGARTLGLTDEALAERHKVSVQLVHFRENIVGVRLKRGTVSFAE